MSSDPPRFAKRRRLSRFGGACLLSAVSAAAQLGADELRQRLGTAR